MTGPRDFAMLAHDIRGALSGVIGGIALLDRAGLDAETRLQFERVSAAAEALSSLVADALGEWKAEQDTEGWGGAEPLRLEAFLGFLERRWSGEARAKGLAFGLVRGPDLPAALRADFIDLSRVLGNLIGNAVKFSDHGGVTVGVRRSEDGGLAISVEDEGPGLGEGETSRLFEFGYRSSPAAKPGQGMGLHIAQTLAERLGGRISLANRPAGGVEAVLVLPRRLVGDDAGGDDAPERGLPDLGGLRILLAEDNPTNQMVASQMLRSMDAEVEVADDGEEALARFEAGPFDLLIVDIEMPRKSGLDVIRAVRARPDRRARTPIVALTAYALREHRDRIAEAGADGLISKPIVSLAAFGRAVAAIVRPGGRAVAFEAPPEAAAGGPAIDLEVYRGLAQTIGAEMMAELLDRVVIDLQTVERNLARAAAPLDPAAVRAASHILISVAGAVGAVRLQTRARQLNAEAHAAPGPALEAGIAACLEEIATALRFVRDERARC